MKKITLKKIVPLLIIVLISFIYYSPHYLTAYADDPAPYVSFKIEFEEGNKIFYMTLADEETEEQLKTGLYYKTGENIYLFEKDYCFYENSMVFSNDGLCFAYFPWASSKSRLIIKDRSGTAIMFFKEGALLKEYAVKEVLKIAWAGSYSVSHVSWEKTDKRKFNPETNILSVTAKDSFKYIFDITTGNKPKGKGTTGCKSAG